MIALSELKTRAENAKFQYSFGLFKRPVNPPHLIVETVPSNNFGADNKVYLKINKGRLQLTTTKKDMELENKIENEILYDIFWNKSETVYISNEGVYNTSYFFEIKEE